MFELGARPHPPRELYRAYLEQSDVFVGIYWRAATAGSRPARRSPASRTSTGSRRATMPKLIYVKDAADREERSRSSSQRIRRRHRRRTRPFSTAGGARRARRGRPRDAARRAVRRVARAATVAAAVPRRLDGVPAPVHRGDRAARPRSPTLLALPRARTCAGSSRSSVPAGSARAASRSRSPTASRDRFDRGDVRAARARARSRRACCRRSPDALGVRDSARRRRRPRVARAGDRRISSCSTTSSRSLDAAPARRAAAHRAARRDVPRDESRPAPAARRAASSTSSRSACRRSLVRRPHRRRARSPPPCGCSATARGRRSPLFEVTDENVDAVRAHLPALDGVPLAIELAAARIRVLTPAACWNGSTSVLPLLVASARDLPERQRTIAGDGRVERRPARTPSARAVRAARRVRRRLQPRRGRGGRCRCDGNGRHADRALGADRQQPRAPSGRRARPLFGMLVTVREFALAELEKSGSGGRGSPTPRRTTTSGSPRRPRRCCRVAPSWRRSPGWRRSARTCAPPGATCSRSARSTRSRRSCGISSCTGGSAGSCPTRAGGWM